MTAMGSDDMTAQWLLAVAVTVHGFSSNPTTDGFQACAHYLRRDKCGFHDISFIPHFLKDLSFF